jgi:predicted nucleotidyltransferase
VASDSIAAIVRTLNAAGIRYLVVGGLAVAAHGHARSTADVDLFVDLESENLRSAASTLASLGYRPSAPVALYDLPNPLCRHAWAREQQLTVLRLVSPEHPQVEVDLDLAPPIAFDAAFERAHRANVAPGTEAAFLGLEDLIAWKRTLGRPKDLEDVEKLLEVDGRRMARRR